MTLLRGPGTPWARMQAARRELDRIIYAEIERRARERGARRRRARRCCWRRATRTARASPTDELRDQLMHLLFGGHDTTSSTLSFLIYELSRHPDVLDGVVEELRSGAGRRGRRRPSELLSGLPYLVDGDRRDAAAVPAGVVRPADERHGRSRSAATGSRPECT